MYQNISDWDRMVNGRLYNAESEDIRKQHIEGMTRCQKYNRISYKRKRARQRALDRLIPSSKGKNMTIFSPFSCEYGVNIHVGEGCFVNYNCVFLDIAPITLGDSVWIGASVTLATPMHPFLDRERIYNEYPDNLGPHDLEYGKPITIDDHVWICSGAVILGGVHIGKNSIVAAGSVVTKDVPDNVIVAGVPARVVRPIDEEDRMDVWDTYVKNLMPLPLRKK